MARETTTETSESNDNCAGLEIALDPDALVDALAADGKSPGRNGNMVVTVRPPFDGECSAETRFSESGTFWPPEMSPKPLDLSPGLFHDAEFSYPESWEINEAAKEVAGVENNEDVPRDVWDECRDVQVEVWESEIRNSLNDEIDINEHDVGASEMVPVRWESEKQ